LIVPCWSSHIRLYETQTGGLRHVGQITFPATRFALSPDGRFIAFGHSGPGVVLADWRATTPQKRSPDSAMTDALWDALASPDSRVGFRAVVGLGAHPTHAVRIIGERLKPVPAADAGAVKKLVADLDAADFTKREAATTALARFGGLVETELRAVVKAGSLEARNRAIQLLRTLDRRDDPERLRALRAVEVLEYADTPDGRAVLRKLAGGAPAARLTLDAKAALARLEALDPKP
jgi:hypothetical protein